MNNEQPKENQRVRLTKRLLQESLFELLKNKSISKISVSELCAKAGINRSTFYAHYGSQYDVLQDIGKHIAENIIHAAKPVARKNVPSPAQQVTEICRYLKDHEEETCFLLTYFSADDPIIQKMMQERFSDINISCGDFTKQVDRDTRHLLEAFMIQGIYSLIRCWILEDIQKTPEELGELAQKLAFSGWLHM